MFECLYGYTPFACEDRHQTKLKILKHKQTLAFPKMEPPYQPSGEAMDLILRLLVEKEKRLCSRRYHLNDYTTQLVAGRPIKFAADKHHKNYQGFFVYADDADDLKRHPFFKHIIWEEMLHKRPPFVPKVKHWEDTKYFDEEQPISDIEDASSVDEEFEAPAEENCDPNTNPGSKASQHHHENQHIVPSLAMQPGGTVVTPQTQISNPLAMPAKADDAAGPVSPPAELKIKKRREKKRPRDKILRDPEAGKTALQIRKNGAFMGYSYRKPKGIQDVLDEVLEAGFRGWSQDDAGVNICRTHGDAAHEKRVYLEAAAGRVCSAVV